MFRSLVKTALKRRGIEVNRLYGAEREEVPQHAWFTFREAQWYRPLSNMGQLSLVEARLLGELVRQSDPTRPIIEIGTLFGYSTLVIALHKAPGQQLITVDNYSWNPLGLRPDAHYELTKNRLAEVTAQHNVLQLRMDKDEFYRSYADPAPALFFCDADHSYEATRADLLWARSKGASIICGDDYNHPFQHGTTAAVDELGGPRRLADGLFVM